MNYGVKVRSYLILYSHHHFGPDATVLQNDERVLGVLSKIVYGTNH